MRKVSFALVLFLVLAAFLCRAGTMDAQSGLANPPPVSLVATISLDAHPKGIALNADANQIYVALFDTSRLARIDGASNLVTGSHDTGGLHANQIAFNPTNARLYVTNRDSDELSLMDPSTLDVIAKYRVGSQPWGVAVDPIGNQVYVDNFGSASISLLDGTNGALVKTFTHPSLSRPGLSAYSVKLRRLYALDWANGNLIVIDASRQLYLPFGLGSGAFDVAVDLNTEKVYMTNRETGQDYIADGAVADPYTMRVSVSNIYPAKMSGIAVNPNTQHYFMVGALNGREILLVRDMRTWDVLQSIDIGSADENEGGQGLEINPLTNRVYVSNYADRTVVVLQDSMNAPTVTPTPNVPPDNTPTFTPTQSVVPTHTPTFMPTQVVPPTATPTPTSTQVVPPTPTATETTPPPAMPYVLTTFAIGKHPKSVTIDGLRRWYGMVALYDDSRVAVFDVQQFHVADSIYTQGTHPNQLVYAGSNRLHITNRDSNNYVGLAWNGPGENCWAPTGELPWGIAPTGNRVYVGNYGSQNWGSISVFNLQCLNLATILLPNDRPAFLAAANNKIYVAGWLRGNLYVIDANNSVRNPINVGPGAFGLTRHDTQPRVYLTNRETGKLYVIDSNNDNITAIMNLPGKAYAVAANYKTNHIFVVDGANDRVHVLDGTTLALLTTLPVGHQDANDGGQGIAVSLETNRVFVTNYTDGTLTVIQDVNMRAPGIAAGACAAPQLASWPDGSTIPYRRVTLDWTDPACATRYEIQIRKNSANGKLVETNTQVPVSQYTTTKALARGNTFVWRVRACGDTKCSKWSASWKFTIAPDAK